MIHVYGRQILGLYQQTWQGGQKSFYFKEPEQEKIWLGMVMCGNASGSVAYRTMYFSEIYIDLE